MQPPWVLYPAKQSFAGYWQNTFSDKVNSQRLTEKIYGKVYYIRRKLNLF